MWAFLEMLDRALDIYYDDPTEALEEMIRLFVDYSSYLLGNSVIPALAVGAVFCAIVVEWVAQSNARPPE